MHGESNCQPSLTLEAHQCLVLSLPSSGQLDISIREMPPSLRLHSIRVPLGPTLISLVWFTPELQTWIFKHLLPISIHIISTLPKPNISKPVSPVVFAS
jgi:hypothetical protein